MYDELFRTLFEKEPSHSEAVPFRMGSGEPCLEGLDTGDLFLHGAGVFQHQAAGVGDALQGGERTAHVDAAVAEVLATLLVSVAVTRTFSKPTPSSCATT